MAFDDDLKLDAFVYPTWSQPPQLIGHASQQPAGDNSQVFRLHEVSRR